jgi:signal transduction histidine kinase
VDGGTSVLFSRRESEACTNQLGRSGATMSHSAALSENFKTDFHERPFDGQDSIQCPLPMTPLEPEAITSKLCRSLKDAGCPLAPALEERLQFEALLAGMSAAFVNIPADHVDSLIESVLQRLVEFLRLDRGNLAELVAAKGHLVITHSYHVPGAPPQTRMVIDDQLPWYSRTIRQGRVLRLNRLPDDLPPEATAEREYCVRIGLKSGVMIPLKVNGAVVGALGLASFRGSREWPDYLIQRLRLVGEIFTNAVARKRADVAFGELVENLRSREQSLQQTREHLRTLAAKLLHAQEEERSRVAREMHDDWTQRLALLGIDFVKLERQLATPETALPLLRNMQKQLIDLSEDVHALSRQLHPSILGDLGLVEALRSECAGFSRREGITAVYYPPGTQVTVAPEVALCVYRVAQEALRNVAKHAKVNEVSVSLAASASELRLRVEDKGIGFDGAATISQAGLGLSSMQERALLMGGQLTVASAPGQGTVAELMAPLERIGS